MVAPAYHPNYWSRRDISNAVAIKKTFDVLAGNLVWESSVSIFGCNSTLPDSETQTSYFDPTSCRDEKRYRESSDIANELPQANGDLCKDAVVKHERGR